jgi:formamidopyrimidine-DNA glycosylase
MPELAEVEYYRKQWNGGLGQRILGVELHHAKRMFRGVDPAALQRILTGAKLVSSEARGKQMVFRFSNGAWLGLHLGMTGKLSEARRDFRPTRHDHLVLRQRKRALVFTDPRVFGRVLFHTGPGTPDWWAQLPEPLTSRAFTVGTLRRFTQRHARAPIKAVLLRQEGFPGIGNWMADEILWRARLHPGVAAGRLKEPEAKQLWQVVRQVCRGAMKYVAKDFGDPPKGWLFNERWNGQGRCPRDGQRLIRETIGGRTTAWCPSCQRPAR